MKGDVAEQGLWLGAAQSTKVNWHQALLEQGRQQAALKEPSRAIYENRFGDNLNVRNERKERDRRSLCPCFWHVGGGRMLCSKIGNPQRGFAQGMSSGEDTLRIPMARVRMQLVSADGLH